MKFLTIALDILDCNENDVRHKLTNNVKRMEDNRMCERNTEHIYNENKIQEDILKKLVDKQ
jgi:hypothetical protein